MIALVTILFGVSWLPIHSFHFALKFFNNFPYDNNHLFAIKNLAHTLTYLNSMLNPFFYTIMGDNFRKQVFAQKAKYSSRLKSYYPRTTRFSNSNSSSITKTSHLVHDNLKIIEPNEASCFTHKIKLKNFHQEKSKFIKNRIENF